MAGPTYIRSVGAVYINATLARRPSRSHPMANQAQSKVDEWVQSPSSVHFDGPISGATSNSSFGHGFGGDSPTGTEGSLGGNMAFSFLDVADNLQREGAAESKYMPGGNQGMAAPSPSFTDFERAMAPDSTVTPASTPGFNQFATGPCPEESHVTPAVTPAFGAASTFSDFRTAVTPSTPYFEQFAMGATPGSHITSTPAMTPSAGAGFCLTPAMSVDCSFGGSATDTSSQTGYIPDTPSTQSGYSTFTTPLSQARCAPNTPYSTQSVYSTQSECSNITSTPFSLAGHSTDTSTPFSLAGYTPDTPYSIQSGYSTNTTIPFSQAGNSPDTTTPFSQAGYLPDTLFSQNISVYGDVTPIASTTSSFASTPEVPTFGEEIDQEEMADPWTPLASHTQTLYSASNDQYDAAIPAAPTPCTSPASGFEGQEFNDAFEAIMAGMRTPVVHVEDVPRTPSFDGTLFQTTLEAAIAEEQGPVASGYGMDFDFNPIF